MKDEKQFPKDLESTNYPMLTSLLWLGAVFGGIALGVVAILSISVYLAIWLARATGVLP